LDCTGCNTSNDSAFVDTNKSVSLNDSSTYVAYPFTTVATKCVTGGFLTCTDGGAETGATYEIWTNNAGSPGSRVGDGYTATVANLPDSAQEVDFIFAATQTLPAGDYWLVWKKTAVGSVNVYVSGSTGWKWSTDGISWTASSNSRNAGVYGCDPS
jgi:hypothetical protein